MTRSSCQPYSPPFHYECPSLAEAAEIYMMVNMSMGVSIRTWVAKRDRNLHSAARARSGYHVNKLSRIKKLVSRKKWGPWNPFSIQIYLTRTY